MWELLLIALISAALSKDAKAVYEQTNDKLFKRWARGLRYFAWMLAVSAVVTIVFGIKWRMLRG